MSVFVNNWWESFCRTFLEMNGYFVLNNVFIDMFDISLRQPHEADLVAYKLPTTKINESRDKPLFTPPADDPVFYAGLPDRDNLIYAEIKANFSQTNPYQDVLDLLNAEDAGEGQPVQTKLKLLAKRYGAEPKVVVFAYHLADTHKARIKEKHWRYKLFDDMYHFMRRRFEHYDKAKLRKLYNDPCLEMLRYETFLKKQKQEADDDRPEAK